MAIVGQKKKDFPDGGVKWMLRDSTDRVFQFYQTNRDGRESSTYLDYRSFVEQAIADKQPVTLTFTEETKVGASGDIYTLYKVTGFVAAE